MSLAPSKPTALAPLAPLHPDQVLMFHEWCRLNRISERTGRRILASGNGPVVTQVSAQRIGVLVKNNARWQASRARKLPAADGAGTGKPASRRRQKGSHLSRSP
jgi:hypothetical protein